MIRLGVNIDHVATVRQARRAREPEPVAAALVAQLGGADCITVHLREDRRHIQDRDVRLLRQVVTAVLNLELSIAEEIVAIACEVKPDQATLVPERRQELTTEGGLDVAGHEAEIGRVVQRLRGQGIGVALFIDPEARQVEASRRVGADAVEFQTGSYADAPAGAERRRELDKLRAASEQALRLGLHVHMGHGLDYVNVADIARIEGVEEVNIGFSIVSRSIFVGLERAVREMKDAIRAATPV